MDFRHRIRAGLIPCWLVVAALLCSGAIVRGDVGEENVRPSAVPVGESPAVRITPIAEILSLPAAARSRTASLTTRGIVTLADADQFFFAIQDDTAGIYVKAMHLAGDEHWVKLRNSLPLGEEVEVTGMLDRGGYAPVIMLQKMRVLGPAESPPPSRPEPARLFHGADNCKRVELSGIVQGFRDDGPHWKLVVEVASRRMVARLSKRLLAMPPEKIVDATVRMVGVLGAIRNTRGDFLCPSIWIASAEDLDVIESPPSEPFDSPRVPLDEIGGYRFESITGHRIQTEGIVTCAVPGQFIYLQQGLVGLRVNTPSAISLTPGDRVKVAGFLDMSRQAAGIIEAIVRRIGHESPLTPVRIAPDEVVRINNEARMKTDIAEPTSYDGCLVTFPARLIEIKETRPGMVLLSLSSGAAVVPSVFEGFNIEPFRQLTPGSDVEVTGVLQIQLHGDEETASVVADPVLQQVGLQLRSIADVSVLSTPSWWTPRRLAALLAGVLAVLAGMLAWVWLLRREMAAQSAILAREMGSRRNAAVEFQATLRERNRLAANLHDTLLQTLRGIDFQLGACRASGDTPARDPWEHLAVAQKMVNHAAEELRGSVWALRTMPVAGTSFADSLATIARQTGHGHAEHIDVQVKGEPFELPQFLAGNLLLVAQEAIHNALAHADAGQIDVVTRFDPLLGSVELSVADDGRGFAEGTQAGPDQGHFGLTGMRERIERLGGKFSVETVTGSGTRIRAKVKKLDYDAQIDVSEQGSPRPEAGVSSTKTSKLKGH